MKNKSRHLLIGLLFAFVCICVTNNLGKWREPRYWEYDVGGYYSYLPSIFIYNDLTTMDAYGRLEDQYFKTQPKYGYHQSAETGKWVNKYPVGVALMQLPFYLIGHFLSLNIRVATFDGYSWTFLMMMMIATIFYSCCGLWYLSRFLNKYFRPNAVLVTLLMIAFGTNLFFYNTESPGLSHPFLFFLISALLYYTDSWYRRPNLKKSFGIGFLIGLCLITRPTALMILIIPLFIFIDKIIKEKPQHSILNLAMSAAGFFMITFVQMLYWKITSNHWIYYSYGDEGFDFLHPHILEGLFSYRKGWFLYTPIALVGMAGLWQIYKSPLLKKYFYPVIIYFVLIIYVVYSWKAWFYGGGFGSRVMIDSYGVLALPLCALIEHVMGLSKKPLKIIGVAIGVFLIVLNLFQTYQFDSGVVPWDGVNKKYYWSTFGDVTPSKQKKQLLDPEFR